MNSVIELNRTRLRYPLALPRNSPDCLTALIGAIARSQFGIGSIAKAWFNYGFVFERSDAGVGLLGDGRTLDMTLGRSTYAARQLTEKLRHYYGLGLTTDRFEDFASALETIGAALQAGELIMASFCAGLVTGWHQYGNHQLGMHHLICPTRLDQSRGTLTGLESIGGTVEVDLRDYECCFELARKRGASFVVMRCRREFARDEPIVLADLRRDLHACVLHLYSESPGEGLTALRCGAAALLEAVERLRTPVYDPGIWTFTADRYSMQEQLPHWKAAVAATDAVAELDRLLHKVIAAWSGVSALLTAAICERDATVLLELPSPLKDAVAHEEQLASAVSQLYRRLA